MLLAFAMMAQDVPLNADAAEAINCGRAIIANPPASQEAAVPGMMQVVYFMMSAAAAHPVEGRRFIERAGDLAPEIFTRDAVPADQAGAILARCDKRFPLARSTAPAKLPADPFQRDLMCAGAASYEIGILEGAGLKEVAAPLKRIQEGFLERIPDTLLKQHGFGDADSVTGAMDDALRGTLRIGNLHMIVQACGKVLGGK